MESVESASIALALMLMIGAALVSAIPFLPGPVLVWGIGLVYAALTNFERATPAAALVMTLLMLAGATSEFWLPLFGVRGQSGMSCLSAIGSLIGGVIGTFAIPIPIIGTLVGSVIGALLVELIHRGQLRQALNAGRIALKLYLTSMILEFAISFGIIIVFIIGVWSTG